MLLDKPPAAQFAKDLRDGFGGVRRDPDPDLNP
jgi:hypothetical protein